MKTKNVSRNAPCPCGSGLKYKNCHAGKVPWYKQRLLTGIIGILIILGGALLVWAGSDRPENGPVGAAPAGQVWSPEHGHYHDAP